MRNIERIMPPAAQARNKDIISSAHGLTPEATIYRPLRGLKKNQRTMSHMRKLKIKMQKASAVVITMAGQEINETPMNCHRRDDSVFGIVWRR